MSLTTLPPWEDPQQPPPFPVRRFTVEEYHALMETGLLTDDERVELLEGWIVPKMNHNPLHDSTVNQIDEMLRSRIPAPWTIRIQSSITTGDSEPEPDLAVVPGPAARYKRQHPRPAEVALLVEVADSSLLRDRIGKQRLYARAGIAVYWIANLVDQRIEVYTDPAPDEAPPCYRSQQHFAPGDSVPLTIPGIETFQIPVAELLPDD